VTPEPQHTSRLREQQKIYHGEAVKKLTAVSAAYESWNKEGIKCDWMDAVKAATKLEPKYFDQHSGAIQAGSKGFETYCLRRSAPVWQCSRSSCVTPISGQR
jgi:hypothetical protein